MACYVSRNSFYLFVFDRSMDRSIRNEISFDEANIFGSVRIVNWVLFATTAAETCQKGSLELFGF